MPQQTLQRIFIFVFAVAAVCINLSWIHQNHDADSLLTSLISIEQWTPYYWGDNRFGMLLPLIASAVRSYIPNLVVQTQLSVSAALLTAVLFQCFFLDRDHGFTARNLAGSCLTILFAMAVFRPHTRVVQVLLLPSHPYFTSLALALAGLIALLRYRGDTALRYSFAAVALLASFWVNWTNGPVIIGLALLLPSSAGSVRDHLRARAPAVAVILAALIAMYSFSQLYPRLLIAGIAPLSQARNTIARMSANVLGDMLFPVRAAILVVATLIAAAYRWRRAFLRNLLSFGESQAIIGIALGFALAVASTEWVIRNFYEWRYWTVPIALIFLVIASYAADSVYLLLQYLTGSAPATILAVALVFVAGIVHEFGLPSLAFARAGIESVSGAHYDKVESLGCTHMLGDYWVAWSSVFFNRSRNIDPPLWAVSLRSEATESLWSKTPPTERRYCGVCGDTMNNYYIIVFKLGALRHTGQADHLCRFQQ
jgi:hypothetical protein